MASSLPLSVGPRTLGVGWLAVLAGLLVGLGGCARLERARECQRLAVTVNRTLGEVERLASAEDFSEEEPPVDAGAPDAALPDAAPPGLGRRGGTPPSLVVAPSDAGLAPEGSAAAPYRKMSALYLELAQELTTLEFSDERLAKQVDLYSKLMKRVARALDRLASANRSGTQPVVRSARAELTHLTERQRATSQQIDQICLSP